MTSGKVYNSSDKFIKRAAEAEAAREVLTEGQIGNFSPQTSKLIRLMAARIKAKKKT